MAVVIRLARRGKKKKAFYHFVATDSRNPRDGKFLETVGSYDPNYNPPRVEIDSARLDYWTRNGAVLSETVGQLVRRSKKTPVAATAKA